LRKKLYEIIAFALLDILTACGSRQGCEAFLLCKNKALDLLR